MKLQELITELTTVLNIVGDDAAHAAIEIHKGCTVDGVTWNGDSKIVELDTDCYCGYEL